MHSSTTVRVKTCIVGSIQNKETFLDPSTSISCIFSVCNDGTMPFGRDSPQEFWRCWKAALDLCSQSVSSLNSHVPLRTLLSFLVIFMFSFRDHFSCVTAYSMNFCQKPVTHFVPFCSLIPNKCVSLTSIETTLFISLPLQ